MRFSNEDILKVICQSMKQSIQPQLTSRDSQAAYSTICLGLDELMKRETRTESILIRLIPEGFLLAEKLTRQLTILNDSSGAHQKSTLDDLKKNSAITTLPALEASFNNLLKHMEISAKALSIYNRMQEAAQSCDINNLLALVADWELSFYELQRPPLRETTYDKTLQSGALTTASLNYFLQNQPGLNQDIAIKNLERIPGGMSKETYFFDLLSKGISQPLVVRKNDPKPALTGGIYDLRQEFALVKAVYESGFSVPKPLYLGHEEKDIDGSFYVIERASGQVAGSVFGAEGTLPEKVLLDLAKQMATLHTLPITTFEDYITNYEKPEILKFNTTQCIEYYLQWWYDYWKTFTRLNSPTEVYLFDWLFNNIPKNSNPPSLIHGDFSLHNFLYEDNKITAVLDWEGSHFGDPAEDLAYAKRHVSKHMNWDKFMAHYNACGGPKINQKTFAYYDCLTNTRNLIATNKVASRIKHRDTNDTKDLYLALEFIPEFMKVSIENIKSFESQK